VKDAPCRNFSPRWKTANRGVNDLTGTRSMSKITGLAVGGVHLSASHSPFQSARKVLRVRQVRRALVKWKGTLLCRKRSALRRGCVQVKLYPCWESPGHLWQHRPADHQRIYRRRIRHRFNSSLSVRRKSPTSAWRRSISSTRKTLEHCRQGYNLLEQEAAAADMAAAADTAAADMAAAAVSEAAAAAHTAAAGAAAESVLAEAAAAAGAAAAAAAGAGAGAAAACHGEVATSARLEHLPITLMYTGHQSRV
jgi:hypothetical protein